jgi:hypothetical protein
MKLLGITLGRADVALGGNGGQAEEKFAFFNFERLARSVVLLTLFFRIFFSLITGTQFNSLTGIETFVHILRDQAGQRDDSENMKEKFFHS